MGILLLVSKLKTCLYIPAYIHIVHIQADESVRTFCTISRVYLGAYERLFLLCFLYDSALFSLSPRKGDSRGEKEERLFFFCFRPKQKSFVFVYLESLHPSLLSLFSWRRRLHRGIYLYLCLRACIGYLPWSVCVSSSVTLLPSAVSTP